MQTDLFGEVIATPSVRTQAQRKVTSTKLVFDRKALWSTSGYLPGAVQVEKENLAEATSTSDTRSDNATLERLEQALGLEPLTKNGQWVSDALGYHYRRKGKPFTGAKRFGEKGSLLRDLNKQLTLTSARDAIEPLFTDPCSWLVINSIIVLDVRLRMMAADEDHQSCLKAFLGVLAQHDFIDNSRTGETIRSLTRRDQSRDRRAAARAAKGLPPLEVAVKPSKVESLGNKAPAAGKAVSIAAAENLDIDDLAEEILAPESDCPEPLVELDEDEEFVVKAGSKERPISRDLIEAFESDDFDDESY